MTTYNELRPSLKTGDLVFFSGKGLFSSLIKIATKSKWSHIGVVLEFQGEDYIALWESTTLSNIKDIPTNRTKKGVQIVPLSKRIELYKGKVAFRQLQYMIPKASTKLVNLRNKLKNKKYEASYAELLKAVYDGVLGKNKADLSSIFCSELVAEAYKSLRLLDRSKPSNEYTPADFESLNTLKHNSLGPMVELTK